MKTLITLTFALFLVIGCGQKSPEAVITSIAKEKDLGLFYDSFSKEVREDWEDQLEEMLEDGWVDKKYKKLSAKEAFVDMFEDDVEEYLEEFLGEEGKYTSEIKEDDGEVTAVISLDGEELEGFTMIKEDGKWVIDVEL